MHILYILNEFPKLSESFIINELYELEQRGHNLSIVAFKKIEHTIEHNELEQLNADVYYLSEPSIKSAIKTILNRPNIMKAINQSRSLSITQTAGVTYIATHLKQILDQLPTKPDHIHTHFFDWPKFALEQLSIDVPITVTAHAFGLYEQGTNEQRRRLAEQFDRIVTISSYNKEYLEETIGVTTPIGVVRMGINPNKFTPIREAVPHRILTVARFVEKKGIRYGIDAIAEVSKTHPEIEYHIIGGGPLQDSFETQIKKHSLENTVKILGRVSDKKLITELDQAAMFLLPCVVAQNGDRDGIPVSIMEAMAMGAVPISTTVSGIPELITNGDNGYLASPSNTSELAKAIKTMLSNPALRMQLTSAAQQTIMNSHTIQSQVDGIESIFNHNY